MKIDEVVGRTPEYRLKQHQARLDKPEWRAQQQRRFSQEEENSDQQRHVPKSQIGYKPNAIPLIRFGRFRTRSKIGLDSGMKREFGNMTHEAGISVYLGYQHKNGWMAAAPDKNRARYNVVDPFAPLDQFGPQLIAYLDHGTPMDIFLIYGHLAAFGAGKAYLEIGSDGEYLLDATQPYRMERLFPEFTYMDGDLNFIQYMNAKYARTWGYGQKNDAPAAGIAYLRQKIADDQDELA